MKTFGGESEQEKATSRLIHDSNHALSEIKFTTEKMGEWLSKFMKDEKAKNPDFKISSEPFVRIEYLKKWHKEMTCTLDVFIEKFKNDFQPEQK
jgi:hypothetical protein